MTDGLILLAIIAALLMFCLTWARRRFGMGKLTTGRWVSIAVGIGIVILIMWAYSTH